MVYSHRRKQRRAKRDAFARCAPRLYPYWLVYATAAYPRRRPSVTPTEVAMSRCRVQSSVRYSGLRLPTPKFSSSEHPSFANTRSNVDCTSTMLTRSLLQLNGDPLAAAILGADQVGAGYPQRKDLPSTESIWIGPIIERSWTKGSIRNAGELLHPLDSVTPQCTIQSNDCHPAVSNFPCTELVRRLPN